MAFDPGCGRIQRILDHAELFDHGWLGLIDQFC
jgi:hypothetical protein